MRSSLRRLFILLTVWLLVFYASGCQLVSLNADSLLRAPKLTGDQAAVQQALEQYIVSRVGETQADYTLKYPKDGDRLTSFLFLDHTEEPTRAMAFYCCPALSANARILYLEKKNGSWKGLVDTEGNSEDIGQVYVGDIDADGQQELLVGWNIYTARDKRLIVYDTGYEKGEYYIRSVYDTSYSAMMVTDMTDSSADDLLLFNIVTTEAHVSARLLSYEHGAFSEKGMTRLDGSIIGFSKGTSVQWENGLRGVFIDGNKDSNTIVTELVVWDGSHLLSPLYDAAKNATLLTARESRLPHADINGNGIPEWPISQRLPGYEETHPEETLWLTTYYEWSYQTQQGKATVTALVNAQDGYRITLGADLRNQITAVYHKTEHLLEMRLIDSEQVLLRVVVCGANERLEPGYAVLQQTVGTQCAFWVPDDDQALINSEQARYMINFIQ